jgi:hypothetical protein
MRERERERKGFSGLLLSTEYYSLVTWKQHLAIGYCESNGKEEGMSLGQVYPQSTSLWKSDGWNLRKANYGENIGNSLKIPFYKNHQE